MGSVHVVVGAGLEQPRPCPSGYSRLTLSSRVAPETSGGASCATTDDMARMPETVSQPSAFRSASRVQPTSAWTLAHPRFSYTMNTPHEAASTTDTIPAAPILAPCPTACIRMQNPPKIIITPHKTLSTTARSLGVIMCAAPIPLCPSSSWP